jgi:hypothetical protein
MRRIVLGAAAAAAILSAGFLANPAEAMIGAPASVSLAAEAVAPVENVWWCGWRCRHHRVIIIRRHHHRCWWGGWC